MNQKGINVLKLVQIILAILIGLGLLLLFSQNLWIPKVVKFQLEQEGIYEYYISATDNFDI